MYFFTFSIASAFCSQVANFFKYTYSNRISFECHEQFIATDLYGNNPGKHEKPQLQKHKKEELTFNVAVELGIGRVRHDASKRQIEQTSTE